MPRTKRTSPLFHISKEALEQIVKESKARVEVLEKIGLIKTGYYYRALNERLKSDQIDISHFQRDYSYLTRINKIKIEDILVENSNYGGKNLKKRLLEHELKKDVCEECGVTNIWNNKKIVLEVHHKNGNSKDNRIENLQVLCPNCHSQTDNFSGKSKKDALMKKFSKEYLIDILNNKTIKESCDILDMSFGMLKKIISKYQIEYKKKFNLSFGGKNNVLRFTVSKEELEKLVSEKPFTQIGKQFGVSDNAVRKRCKKLGIEIPKNGAGYWAKKKYGKI